VKGRGGKESDGEKGKGRRIEKRGEEERK